MAIEPDRETGNLFLWVSGFGLGALVATMIFGFLIGVRQLGPPVAQTASAPGQTATPSPQPSPGPSTTGQGTPPASGSQQAQ